MFSLFMFSPFSRPQRAADIPAPDGRGIGSSRRMPICGWPGRGDHRGGDVCCDGDRLMRFVGQHIDNLTHEIGVLLLTEANKLCCFLIGHGLLLFSDLLKCRHNICDHNGCATVFRPASAGRPRGPCAMRSCAWCRGSRRLECRAALGEDFLTNSEPLRCMMLAISAVL